MKTKQCNTLPRWQRSSATDYPDDNETLQHVFTTVPTILSFCNKCWVKNSHCLWNNKFAVCPSCIISTKEAKDFRSSRCRQLFLPQHLWYFPVSPPKSSIQQKDRQNTCNRNVAFVLPTTEGTIRRNNSRGQKQKFLLYWIIARTSRRLRTICQKYLYSTT